MIFEAPLINAQGQHTGWMGSFIDVSEQRRVEELSRTSQERLQATARLATVGKMASLLSHELNQPLAAISSYANGLAESAGARRRAPSCRRRQDLQDVRVGVQRIAFQADRAGKVIKSVRDFVRRRDQTREAGHRARSLFDAVMPLIRLQAQQAGRARECWTIEAGLPPVLCDRTMIEQVLLNLARNAMQSMDDPQIHPRILDCRCARAASDASRSWLEFSVERHGHAAFRRGRGRAAVHPLLHHHATRAWAWG